jgi:hypothetical protein
MKTPTSLEADNAASLSFTHITLEEQNGIKFIVDQRIEGLILTKIKQQMDGWACNGGL